MKIPYGLTKVVKDYDITSADTTPIEVTDIPVGNLNDSDDMINSLDWAVISSKWGTNDAISDLNADTLVNSLDWSIMNKNWGKSGEEGGL